MGPTPGPSGCCRIAWRIRRAVSRTPSNCAMPWNETTPGNGSYPKAASTWDRWRGSTWTACRADGPSAGPENLFQLRFGHEGALQPNKSAAMPPEQVAAAEQVCRIGLLGEDQFGVPLADDPQTDAAGQVTPQQGRDHRRLRPLRAEHEMNAGRPGLGAQATQQGLQLFLLAAVGHQVGELVEHHDPARHSVRPG